LAHKLALESDAIRSDMVEAIEFPHLATKYGVMGVPKTVINEEIEFEGALPEDLFVSHLMSALST
jgi:predicted DsbA family dithiol-disulfide isomerase